MLVFGKYLAKAMPKGEVGDAAMLRLYVGF
jgi:hypothetical protein